MGSGGISKWDSIWPIPHPFAGTPSKILERIYFLKAAWWIHFYSLLTHPLHTCPGMEDAFIFLHYALHFEWRILLSVYSIHIYLFKLYFVPFMLRNWNFKWNKKVEYQPSEISFSFLGELFFGILALLTTKILSWFWVGNYEHHPFTPLVFSHFMLSPIATYFCPCIASMGGPTVVF